MATGAGIERRRRAGARRGAGWPDARARLGERSQPVRISDREKRPHDVKPASDRADSPSPFFRYPRIPVPPTPERRRVSAVCRGTSAGSAHNSPHAFDYVAYLDDGNSGPHPPPLRHAAFNRVSHRRSLSAYGWWHLALRNREQDRRLCIFQRESPTKASLGTGAGASVVGSEHTRCGRSVGT